MNNPIHTSDRRQAKKLWIKLGGQMVPVRGTGELRYLHPAFNKSVRANNRRHDVPAVILSRINQLIKMAAANDASWQIKD